MLITQVQSNTGIVHPLVRNAYFKKDCTAQNQHHEDVLVLETAFDRDGQEYESFDSYLYDLLLDLEELKKQAEIKFGHIDRIDIRSHE